MENTDMDDIILLDDEGTPTHFAHLLTFAYEGARYVALEPVGEETDLDAEEEAEVVLLRVVERDGEDVYESIDNEILLQEVFDEFLDLMDEAEDA